MKSMKILAILAPLVLAELPDSCGKAGGSKTAALLQLPNGNQSQKLRLGLVFSWRGEGSDVSDVSDEEQRMS